MVLERIARGGVTNWYVCERRDDLRRVAAMLRSGSRVSFYLDGRIERIAYGADTGVAVRQFIERHGEALVGRLGADGVQIDMCLVSGLTELQEREAEIYDAEVFIGEFPAPDNDGVRAINFQLPDEDGVVRPHPH